MSSESGGAGRVAGSTWTLGVLAAIASWNLSFAPPFGGLDPSWWAGLYMAGERGMDFGTEIVFTFGPLGFLRKPWLWDGDLAVLAFIYTSLLRIALAVSLVWALRRTVNGAVALLLTCLILLAAPSAEVPLCLAFVWCLAALSPDPPWFAVRLVVFGGATLGAIETLVLLRSGPAILIMCLVTLLVQERRLGALGAFVGSYALAVALLWFAARQGLGNLPEFVSTAFQTVSGYSEAMGYPASSDLYLPVIVLVGAVLVAAAVSTSAAGRTRLAAAAVTGLTVFLMYKEAVVRAEPGHTAVFFATAVVIGASLAFGGRRWLAIAAVAVLVALTLRLPSEGRPSIDFNPVTHAGDAADQLRTLVSPARRHRLSRDARAFMVAVYDLGPSTERLLRGHSVHVDPWETAVVWAYGLDWDPLPVFQDVTTYTTALDRLNADALRSPDGPERILRENTGVVDPNYPLPAVDSRHPSWDPPEQSIAMLCNYVPLRTTTRWQVLGKVPDRCGGPRRIGSAEARSGTTVRIPAARSGGVVLAKIHGAGVSGLERPRTFLYRARLRYAVVNGSTRYRLVPGTATDGLIMGAAPGVDYEAPFALSPAARTIELDGVSGAVRLDFYWMRVRSQPGESITAAPRS